MECQKRVTGFAALSDPIIGQHIYNQVAKVLRRRCCALFEGGIPAASSCLQLNDIQLRSAGLLKSKMSYIWALAHDLVGKEVVLMSFPKRMMKLSWKA